MPVIQFLIWSLVIFSVKCHVVRLHDSITIGARHDDNLHNQHPDNVMNGQSKRSMGTFMTLLARGRKKTRFRREMDSMKKYFREMASKFTSLPEVIKSTLLLNVAVWICWQFSHGTKYEIVMMENWVDSASNLEKQRWWTMLTNNFSHESLVHLWGNMGYLVRYGPAVLNQIDDDGFIVLMIVSGFMSSFFSQFGEIMSLLFHNRRGGRAQIAPKYSLGFSGVNAAIMVMYAVMSKEDEDSRQSIYDWLLSELTEFTRKSQRGIDHAAHVGGFVAGLIQLFFHFDEDWDKQEEHIFNAFLIPVTLTFGALAIASYFRLELNSVIILSLEKLRLPSR